MLLELHTNNIWKTIFNYFLMNNMKKTSTNIKMMLAATVLLLTGSQNSFAVETVVQKVNVQHQENLTLKGLVLDEAGMPVIGASVMIKGSKTGTVTDLNGRFEINAKGEATVVVSYVGYKKEEVVMRSGKVSVINLTSDGQDLDEVVVTGYGTFKKSAYAGSAATVKTESMKDVPGISVNEMLQGAAPGVTMQQASGQPGSYTALNVRGMGSFNASSSPLYVIDGVPVISGDISALGTDAGLDALSTLNPSDIESLTVIKDAAAASLYGSRAANGVIIITTKKGKVGTAKVGFKADWGFSDFAMDYRKTLSGEQRRDVLQNAFYNDYISQGYSESESTQYALEGADKYAPKPWCGYTDWRDIMFQKGSHSNYETNVSGGNDRAKYYASLGYMNQEGITLNSGLRRISARVNTEFKATNHFTFGLNTMFSDVKQDAFSEGTSYTSPFYSTVSKVTPSDPVYNEDGSWNRDFIGNGDRNPLLSMKYDSKKEYVTRFMNTLWGEYEFIDNLKFKSTLSYDYQINKSRNWYDPRTSNGDDYNGLEEDYMYERKKFNWSNQLTYKYTWNDAHNIDLLAGYEVDDQQRSYIGVESQNFATGDKHVISNGAKVSGGAGSNNGTRIISYLARANYDYMNKYFFGASYRIDGSSRLAEDSRWGSFWSLSGAWRFSDEAFFEPVKGIITDGKLRASYGINGTLPSDYYGYMGLSSLTANYNAEPGMYPSQIENKDLKWEKNRNFNVGVDLRFIDRINLTVEYYTRTTKDLLMDYPISMTTGFGSYLYNIGKVRNQGVEFELSADIFRTKDFSWTSSLNLAHNQNKVLELDGAQTEIVSGVQIHKIGKSYRTFYVYEFAGINPENGNPMFYTNDIDENGNLIKEATEELDKCNRIEYKKAEADLTGGFINTLRYKWFDLSFNLSFQLGGYAHDKWTQKVDHAGADYDLNLPAYYANAWKQPGDITDIERINVAGDYVMADYYQNTRSVHSTDFLRLRNITFGASLPKEWTKKLGINRCRFYVSGANLWTTAKYDYYDPEATYGGSTIWGTPPLKSVTFGIDLSI